MNLIIFRWFVECFVFGGRKESWKIFERCVFAVRFHILLPVFLGLFKDSYGILLRFLMGSHGSFYHQLEFNYWFSFCFYSPISDCIMNTIIIISFILLSPWYYFMKILQVLLGSLGFRCFIVFWVSSVVLDIHSDSRGSLWISGRIYSKVSW